MKKVCVIVVSTMALLCLIACQGNGLQSPKSRHVTKPLTEEAAEATVKDFFAHGKWTDRDRVSLGKWYGLTQYSEFEYRVAAEVFYGSHRKKLSGFFVFHPDVNGDWVLNLVAFRGGLERWENAVHHKVVTPKPVEVKPPQAE